MNPGSPAVQRPMPAPGSQRSLGMAASQAGEPVRTLIPIALVLALAIALRVWDLQSQSLSMDEFAELNIARGSLAAIVVAQDGFPPLYNLLLHGWLSIFPSDEAARWLSVLLGTAAVLIIGKLGQQVRGTRAGVASALLLAASPLHIWHSQEGRAYALYFLLAALALWLFFRALDTNHLADWLWYASASLIGLYAHYYFAFLLVVNVGILVAEQRTWRQLRRPLMAHALLVLGSLPLVWLARVDLSGETVAAFASPFRLAAIGYSYFSFIAGYSIGPSARELHTMSAANAVRQLLPWLAWVALSVAVLGYRGFVALGSKKWRLRLAAIAVMPVLASTVLAGLVGVTFQVRHVLWAAIPVFVWLGAGLAHSTRHWFSRAAMATLLIVSAISLHNRNAVERYQNEDLRGVGAYLRSHSNPSAPIFVSPAYMAHPMRHYAGPGLIIDSIPDVNPEHPELVRVLSTIDSQVTAGGTFWLVYSRPFHGDPRGQLRNALVRQRSLRHRADFSGIVLYDGKKP